MPVMEFHIILYDDDALSTLKANCFFSLHPSGYFSPMSALFSELVYFDCVFSELLVSLSWCNSIPDMRN